MRLQLGRKQPTNTESLAQTWKTDDDFIKWRGEVELEANKGNYGGIKLHPVWQASLYPTLTPGVAIGVSRQENTRHCVLRIEETSFSSSLPSLNELFSCTAGHEALILVPCVLSPEQP